MTAARQLPDLPVPAPASPVPSPCVSICTMDPANGLCVGCLRTIDEIATWSMMSEAAKRSVWAQLPARRTAP